MRFQFTLGALLLLMTAVAIGAALVAQLGVGAALVVFLLAELALTGVVCVASAVQHRRGGWVFGLVMGIMLLLMAAAPGFIMLLAIFT